MIYSNDGLNTCTNMDNSNSGLGIYDLPPYILIHIFKFINKTDLLFSVRHTCCLWNELSQERVLWRTLDVKNFPSYTFTPKAYLDLLRSTCDSIEHLHFDVIQHDLKTIKHEGTLCTNLKEVSIGVQSRIQLANSTTCISPTDLNNGLVRLSEKYPALKKLSLLNQVLLHEDIFRNLEDFVYESVDRTIGRIRAKEFLRFHPGLKSITLRRCILSAATLTKILTEYPYLELLDLCGCTCVFDEVNYSVNEETINVANLTSLNVSETDIVDSLVKKIVVKANEIKLLNLAKCQRVTNATIEAVARNCPNIETLIINEQEVTVSEGLCDITTAGLERIAENCHCLKVLKLNFCPEVENTGIAALANGCKKLVELEIAGCLSLQDATVLALVRNCSNIQRLNLGGCPQLTGTALSFLLKHCRNLKYLNIETCHRITNINITPENDDSVCNTDESNDTEVLDPGNVATGNKEENIMDIEDRPNVTEYPEQNLTALLNHSHVRVLNLSFCSAISNNCMKQIARHCADLQELDIQACYMVTNAGVRELLKRCKFLSVLNISGGSVSQTSRLTDECLSDVVTYGRAIKKLVIVKNYNITADAVFDVIQNCNEIQSVSVAVSKRSNIKKETLIELCGRIKGKTTCLKIRADVEILIYKDAEMDIRQNYKHISSDQLVMQ